MRGFGLDHKYESNTVDQISDYSCVLALRRISSSGRSLYPLAWLCEVTSVSSTGTFTALSVADVRKMKVN